MRDAHDRAVHLAQHYFRLIATRAGVPWDGDNDTEIEVLVDSIADTARAEVRELRAGLSAACGHITALEDAGRRLASAFDEQAGIYDMTRRSGMADPPYQQLAEELTELLGALAAAAGAVPGPCGPEPDPGPLVYDPGPGTGDEDGPR